MIQTPVFVLAFATALAILSIWRIAMGSRRSADLLQLVFYLFFVLPRIVDRFIVFPDMSMYPGFSLAQQDLETSFLYSVFLVIASASLAMAGTGWKATIDSPAPRLGSVGRLIAYTLSLVPLVAVALSPKPTIYFNYAFFMAGAGSEQVMAFHSVVSALAIVSIVAAGSLLVGLRNREQASRLIAVGCILVDIWLVGKRAALAVGILTLLVAAWQSSRGRNVRVVFGGAITVAFLGIFSIFYQRQFRSDIADATNYLSYRIDYARDSQVMMAIFARLNSGIMQILEYPGQSFLFNVFAYVPRELWESKPYPYAYYFTSALLLERPQHFSWGMTTSLFDEIISNIGLIGLVLGPIIAAVLARAVDGLETALTRMVGLILLCLLFVLQAGAVMSLAVGLALLVLAETTIGSEKTQAEGESSASLGS